MPDNLVHTLASVVSQSSACTSSLEFDRWSVRVVGVEASARKSSTDISLRAPSPPLTSTAHRSALETLHFA